jgi:hypothetical protein
MINTLIVILFCLASIAVCFFSRIWSWIILAVPFVYLLGQALLVKFLYRWKEIPELSAEANELFKKYGHYYTMPFAGRDFSSASSAVGLTGMIISIIGVFFGFWWGLIGLISIYIGNRLGKFYNPSMFLEMLSNTEKRAHEEIIYFLTKKNAESLNTLNKLERVPKEEDVEIGKDEDKDSPLEVMSIVELEAFKEKYKTNKTVVKIIDDLIEAKRKTSKES